MKKILIFFLMLFLSINNILAEDYDTTPLTLQNFNFEFDYNFQDLNLNLTNFNFEFDYIEQLFQFDLSQYISDYSRLKKLAELYSDLQTAISNYSKWKIIAIGESDNYYIQSNSDYNKFKRLAAKYK
jgi:hypothetical protein